MTGLKTPSRAGFSIVEVLVASALLSVMLSAVVGLLVFFMGQNHKASLTNTRQRQIASMVDSFRSRARQYQIDYSGNMAPLDPANLPIGWDDKAWGPISDPTYAKLPGRAGFRITPVPGNSTLLQVELLLAHPSLTSKETYKFLISASE